MFANVIKSFKNAQVILASTSPRRIEMFKNIDFDVQIEGSNFDENLDRNAYSPSEFCVLTAQGKAKEVFDRFTTANLVIGADTMIVAPRDTHKFTAKTSILGKPVDVADAKATLQRLSGKTHSVVTGVSIYIRGISGKIDDITSSLQNVPHVEVFEVDENVYCVRFYSETEVDFDTLDDETIDAYIATGDPMDKAGAYGIQSLGKCFVTGIRGCFYNVTGFPFNLFIQFLKGISQFQFTKIE